MERRKLLRLKVGDFIEVRSLNEPAKIVRAHAHDITPLGICFISDTEWRKGEVLFIDYFIPDELEPVKLKVSVIWSELVSDDEGFFCGGEVIEIEEDKKDLFINYYHREINK